MPGIQPGGDGASERDDEQPRAAEEAPPAVKGMRATRPCDLPQSHHAKATEGDDRAEGPDRGEGGERGERGQRPLHNPSGGFFHILEGRQAVMVRGRERRRMNTRGQKKARCSA